MTSNDPCPFCGEHDHEPSDHDYLGVPMVVCPKVPKELSGRLFMSMDNARFEARTVRDALGDRAEPGDSDIYDVLRQRVARRRGQVSVNFWAPNPRIAAQTAANEVLRAMVERERVTFRPPAFWAGDDA